MYYDWYKIAKIQQESGLRESFTISLMSALIAVMSGSAIWNAAQKFNVDPSEIENALNNPQIMQSLKNDKQPNVNESNSTNVTNKTKTNATVQAVLNDDLINSLKKLEGTIAYQKATGTFKNGRFYQYTDTNGYPTIGYGHKILSGEDFSKGLTSEQADKLLKQDAQSAINQTNRLIAQIPVTQEAAQILANMVFQLGETGVSNFKNMWDALRKQDYQKASKEMLDSKWAKTDSPNRAKELANLMSKQK